MNLDFTVNIGHFITLATVLVGFVYQWSTLRTRSEANSQKALDAMQYAIDAKKEIQDFRLEVSKEYASNRDMKDMEGRISMSVNELTVELRSLRQFLMERPVLK